MRFRLASVVLTLFSLSICALGQAGGVPSGPQSGPLELIVRVKYDNYRAEAANLSVFLLSDYGSTVDMRSTDGTGTATFTGVSPGRYKLAVTGVDIRRTETSVLDLTDAGPHSTQYVQVHKIDVPTDSVIGGGNTSVAELQIPDKAKKEYDRGNKSAEDKDWDGAKEHFEKALAIYPKYALAENGLALTYASMGQGAKAVETFRAALQLDDHLPTANLYLGQFYYDNNDYKNAEAYLTRAAESQPDAQVLTALANCELRNGELDQALANAEKVHTLKDHKKFAISHLIAADVFTRRNQTQQAEAEYEIFLKEDPHSPLAPRVRDALAKLSSSAH